ncbi:MAG: WYL domain-containing protein [Methylicorpusculum sp.]|uniref:WYL domain-containing protein n=2 Tax=Methylicorpusculum sp. TaxID=2713644 RepID=UPI00273077EA|nr:WYL domain-containing protein [Methylicorpusculum sp.]MDP3529951.1 WYL domain-containing protein [Methylicorpusculum sp.]
MKMISKMQPPGQSVIPLKWDTRQRLALIEATVLWEGRITSSILMQQFGISRGQASKDFSLYHQLAEDNLLYDLNQKAYVASESFTPCFIRGTADEYLRLLEAGNYLGQSVVLPITPTGIGVELLDPPQRKLNFQVLRLVHQAIRQKRQLNVTYHAMNSEPSALTLEPHSLVYNGFRWHIRAYSVTHQTYRDFVLARFLSAPVLSDKALHFAEQDEEWQTFETLTIAPHPDLSPDQQAVIADDFGMDNATLILTVRRALRLYYLRMLHLDGLPESPKVQQIVWVNRAEFEPTSELL